MRSQSEDGRGASAAPVPAERAATLWHQTPTHLLGADRDALWISPATRYDPAALVRVPLVSLERVSVKSRDSHDPAHREDDLELQIFSFGSAVRIRLYLGVQNPEQRAMLHQWIDALQRLRREQGDAVHIGPPAPRESGAAHEAAAAGPQPAPAYAGISRVTGGLAVTPATDHPVPVVRHPAETAASGPALPAEDADPPARIRLGTAASGSVTVPLPQEQTSPLPLPQEQAMPVEPPHRITGPPLRDLGHEWVVLEPLPETSLLADGELVMPA